MRMQLHFPRLHVDAVAFPKILEWYSRNLSMKTLREFTTPTESVAWLGYSDNPQSCMVEFRCFRNDGDSTSEDNGRVVGYTARPSLDAYWKIGLSLADVDTARSRLGQRNVRVSPAGQFRDIGYLCHLSDPFGYSIELLQHSFEWNFDRSAVREQLRPDLALGQSALIGQITLRVADIRKTLLFYVEKLGMALLSRQEVRGAFNLYFLAHTDERPPSPSDIDAVANREWLWKRPYTTLELQHYPSRETTTTFETANPALENGFSALAFAVDSAKMRQLRTAFPDAKIGDEYGSKTLETKDPDNVKVVFVQEEELDAETNDP